MTTFVLVHGTGHGGWCWQKVRPLLRAQGHEVLTPTLSGLSDRSHLLGCGIDLATHITDVTNLLWYEDLADVVLVGHSYAGMVITGVAAAMPERLKQVIYLDAYLPDDGQSEADLWPAEMRASIERDAAISQGLRQPPTTDFFGITDPAMAAWVKARVTAQPVPAGSPRSAALPRTYIHCTAGPTTPLFGVFAAKAHARGWPVHEIATGHDAMLTVPDQVARLLDSLAVPD